MSTSTAASYRTVKDEILRRIREREWRPGMLIPNEIELAAAFGCARATTNRALREVAEMGLLERKRRAGTRVATRPIRLAKLEIPIIQDEIEAAGAIYGYRLIARRRKAAPGWLCRRLGLAKGTKVLQLLCLHLADERPVCFEDRWIVIEAVTGVLDASFQHIGPNAWLVSEVPYSSGEITLKAGLADRIAAKQLGIEVGTALFIVERATFLMESAITHVRLHHMQDYAMRLRF